MPIVNAAQRRMSFTDLQHTPDDGRRYELYDGELRVIPSPIPKHQVVVENIRGLFRQYSEAHGGIGFISPIDIVFSEYDVVQPDVVFFLQSRRNLIDFNVAIRHRPDIVVEVLSPSTSGHDRTKKMQMFARFKVPEYWIADPGLGCLEVHAFERGGYRERQSASGEETVAPPILAPFTFNVSQAFRLP
jgi:Uma2 family endonuclease